MTGADEPKYRGGCLCGRVRYAFSAEPLQVAICHCRNCQKNTGSAFSVNAVFREEAASVSGSLAVFEDLGDSGHPVRRLFCASCGTPIRSMAKQTRGLFVLKAGTLDEPGRVVPTNEVYCDRRIEAWVLPERR